MAVWKYACKTLQGMNLDLKLVSRGNLPLKLTRAVSGAGNISPTQLMGLSGVLDPVQELQILEAVEHLGENRILVPVILRNTSVRNSYGMYQLGVYAQDPDLGEILYLVMQSEGAEEVPSNAEMKDFKLEWYINLAVTNADNVEVVIDETDVLTVEQADARYVFLAEYEKTAERLSYHLADTENPHKTDKDQVGLGNADNTSDMDKPVSTAQQEAIRAAKQEAADALDGHVTDVSAHITTAERDRWNNGSHNYGTCSTDAAAAAKVVACAGFKLSAGAEIAVKFTKTNTAASPTLNVNGTGAKAIYYRGAAISAGTLAANRTYTFRYNGTQWDFVGDINTDTKYTHPVTAGNKHIPSGGEAGQILRWSADGTAVWGADRDTTYSNFVKSGSGAKAGLVPSPGTTAGASKYLREDGTWAVPPDTNTTYSDMKGATADTAGTHGLAPAPGAGAQGKYLRGDGSWQTPANTNNAVTQTNTPSVNANYRLLMSATADDTTRTEGARKDADLTYNPGTNTLATGKVTADTADSTATFTTGDATNPTGWADIAQVGSGEKHSSLWRKMSLAVKNMRYLYKLIGSTDISAVGGGTLTGAVNALNTGLGNKAPSNHSHSDYYPKTGGTVNGHVNAGGKVEMWTDDEGGNVHIEGKDGTKWEIDAFNGNLRIFTYANNVRTGILIDKMGKVTFPSGAADIDWAWIIDKPSAYPPASHRHGWSELDSVPDIGGKMAQGRIQAGYKVDFNAYCFSYSIGDSRYVIKITGRVYAINSFPETFEWGLNLSPILTGLKLNTGMNFQCGTLVAWQKNGGILSDYLGFGTSFTQKTSEGYKILTPGRYHTASGSYGEWNNKSGLALDGNYWEATIVVA